MSEERGTGRTKAMVEAMPPEGGTIIVHNGVVRDYVNRMIRDLRGEPFARTVRVAVVRNYSDCYRLDGLCCHVEVDHAVWENINGETAAKLKDKLYGIRLAAAARAA